jgi:hypothetical protein
VCSSDLLNFDGGLGVRGFTDANRGALLEQHFSTGALV